MSRALSPREKERFIDGVIDNMKKMGDLDWSKVKVRNGKLRMVSDDDWTGVTYIVGRELGSGTFNKVYQANINFDASWVIKEKKYQHGRYTFAHLTKLYAKAGAMLYVFKDLTGDDT